VEDLAIDLTKGAQATFSVVAPEIFILQNMTDENLDDIGEVDAVLEDIGLSLGLIPLKIHI